MNNTLLLVDDETAVRAAMRRSLRDEGYRILEADCGESALQVLAGQPVDVIVTDQRMPQMSGTDLLCMTRKSYPNTVRIMVSGYSDFDALNRAVNDASLFRFVSKPWNDDELRQLIRLSLQSEPQHLATDGSPGNLLSKPALLARVDRGMRTGAKRPQILTLAFDIQDTPSPGALPQLLRLTTARLQQCLPAGSPLARTGQRQFTTALFEHINNTSLTQQALKIERAFLAPLIVNGISIAISWHMGGCIPGDNPGSAEKIFASAGTALERSRHTGTVFECDGGQGVRNQQVALAEDLYRAIKADRVKLRYLPAVNIESRRVTIVESLLQWNNRQVGTTDHNDLLQLADAGDTYKVLYPWYLCNACAQLRGWHISGFNQIQLLKRLSERMLAAPSTPAIIEQALKSFETPAPALILAFTEAGLKQSTEKIRRNLMLLHRLGVQLCLDDFGGDSADIGLLDTLPIDFLRLGRDLDPAADSSQPVLDHARRRGTKIIASGIDTVDRESLWLQQSDFLQGDAYSPTCGNMQIEHSLSRYFELGN